MQGQNIHLIPHIAKTGGSTLVNHLKNLDNNEFCFYHLGPRGRKGQHLNKRCFEIDVQNKIESQNIIVMGHHVDEGILNNFKTANINLSVVLRDPLSRMISHYNMIRSNTDTSKTFIEYLKQRGSYMSLFLIRKFPSFISNPFDSIYEQANSIINRFNKCYFLEDGEPFFNDFLKPFNIQYEKNLIHTRREINYKNLVHDDIVNSKHLNYLRSDYSLYQNQRNNNNNNNNNNIPKIKSVHSWLVAFYNNFINEDIIEYHTNMLNSIPNGFLKKLLLNFKKSNKVDINTFVEIALENKDELNTKSNIINFQELATFFINSNKEYKLDRTYSNSSTDIEKLIFAIQKDNPKHIRQIRNESILSIEYKNSDLLFATAKILFSKKEYESAKSNALESVALNPINAESFYFLFRVFQFENNKTMAIRSLEKCMELNPKNKKFKESYLNIFKYNKPKIL